MAETIEYEISVDFSCIWYIMLYMLSLVEPFFFYEIICTVVYRVT